MRRGESKAKRLKRGRTRLERAKNKTRAVRKDVSAAGSATKPDPKPRARREASATPDDTITLKRALAEAHEREAATANALKAISRSSFDLQVVLDTLVESAARLCEADIAGIARSFGAVYRQVAFYGFSNEEKVGLSRPFEPTRGTIVGRALLSGRPVHVEDIRTDSEYTLIEPRRKGFRTMLGVPLLRDGTPLGVIVLVRRTVRPFTEKQIDLVTTFADQAVIAIENARLFDEVQARTKELTESLEQQTATSEVLSVISSSQGELEPVFQAMLENATRICDARFGTL